MTRRERARLADHHNAAARGIERALEESVFSDDADAVEQLEARIADDLRQPPYIKHEQPDGSVMWEPPGWTECRHAPRRRPTRGHTQPSPPHRARPCRA